VTTPKTLPFSFTGKGGEYFKIWIVNIFLTILTLGIYSAWAKVRTQRWFYAHTQVDGQAFTYLAEPKQILKGHLIALVAFVIYALSSQFLPLLGFALLVVLLIAMPWLVVASLRFNARMSAYRGIRFDFTGGVSESYKVHLLWPLLLVPTLGLILPYLDYRRAKFALNHSHYGNTPVRFEGDLKSFQKVYLKLLAWLLVLLVLGAVVYMLIKTEPLWLIAAASVALIVFYGFMFFAGSYLTAHLSNLMYNNTRMGPVHFESRLQTGRLSWLFFSNLFLMAITLGLFYPWARVRLARYKAAQLSLHTSESLDVFAGGQHLTSGTKGAELADAFDFGAGIV
jgi:uncharacterized membrane protein YjgN (DUF898 family)